MAKKTINLGTGPNTLDGDKVRTAFGKVNDNFDELYGLVGESGADLSAVNQHIVPAADVTYDLGSSAKQWRSLYVSSNTIYLGGTALSVSGDNITVNGEPISSTIDYASIPNIPELAAVATSGSYNDLSDLPTLFSGSYNDLSDRPAIPTDVSELTDSEGLLGGGGSGDTAPYKGFKAHYGRMWGNNDDENGPINKIVIYQDSANPASTIDASTSNDDFQVTGLGGSSVVAVLVAVGQNVNQTSTSELKTFAESVIDNVILDGGVEGQINNVTDMKTAFYDNFAVFSATLTDLKTNFEFFNFNDQFQVLASSGGTGSGLTIYGLSYNMNNDTIDLSGWSNGNGYTDGDVITILGTDIRDGNGNPLTSPANDVTVTITSTNGGMVQTYSVSGTLPRPPEIWPSDNINDGGNDEYDGGNYISTNIQGNIPYNNGNEVIDSPAFGGGDYVVTYKDSIFGIFAVGANIDSIGTSGNSGFDGDGQADTGSLYGAAAATISSLINGSHTLSLNSDGTMTLPGKSRLDSVANFGELRIYPNTDDVSYGIKIYVSYDNDTHIAPVDNNKGLAVGTSYGAGPHIRVVGQQGYSSFNNGEVVVHAQDFNGNNQSEWIFRPNGEFIFPNGGSLRVGVAPASSKGSVGDVAGVVAFDGSFLYYCSADYVDGVADIWRRIAWSADTW